MLRSRTAILPTSSWLCSHHSIVQHVLEWVHNKQRFEEKSYLIIVDASLERQWADHPASVALKSESAEVLGVPTVPRRNSHLTGARSMSVSDAERLRAEVNVCKRCGAAACRVQVYLEVYGQEIQEANSGSWARRIILRIKFLFRMFFIFWDTNSYLFRIFFRIFFRNVSYYFVL